MGGDMMSMDELLKKIQEEGGYQDIIINGEKVADGWRECEERWNMIKDYIVPDYPVLDVGSHYGYFSARCAEQQEDRLVVSVEESYRGADI